MKISPRKQSKVNRRDKQQQVRRWEPNPRLVILVGVMLVMLVAGYAMWLKLMAPNTLPLRQVKLEAPFLKLSKEALYEVVSASITGGFFSLDVDAVTDAVNALPWVRAVKVRRVWPDALHVTVTEQMALARWQDKALVNVYGELFYPALETFPLGLVELKGPENMVALMAQRFSVFNEALKQDGLTMKRVRLTQRRAWELELSNNVVIMLGRSDVGLRLQRFVEFYPQLVNMSNEVKRVDMRYTNGFAVQWRV